MPDTTLHNPHPSRMISTFIFLDLRRIHTEHFCVPCSSGRKMVTSPSMTSASLYTSFVETWHNSPMVTSALALSTEMKVDKVPQLFPCCFQYGLSLQHRACYLLSRSLIMFSQSPSAVPLAKKTTCSFAVSPNCKISSLFGFLQSYGCPRAPHHQPLTLCCLRFTP